MKALVTLVIAGCGAAAIGASPGAASLRGYEPESSARQRAVESLFVDLPSAAAALAIAGEIAKRPHPAGSPGDYGLAVYLRDGLREAGIAAELESFSARVDTPRRLTLALESADSPAPGAVRRHGSRASANVWRELDLAEPPRPGDPSNAEREIGLPFNAGSADGDVRAPLVYAGGGLDADYATLAQAHVDVRGAVVLVRYGARFRGLLAQSAQSHGAAGVIFYSDPQDDGAARGPAYPDGPWRPTQGVERGYVGSGLRIPTLPISAANAEVLLGSLRGGSGPPGWSGGLPVAYPLARGPGRVHLVVALDRRSKTLWNTIGVIPGIRSDQSVILGAHRDAAVYGVGDNGAGLTTLLEVGRGLGFLTGGGWRPQRSIVIAGWDGEENGLAGSRDYVRRHALALERGCATYLNADQSVSGPRFGAAAAAALAPLAADITHEVSDPGSPTASVYDRWAAQSPGSAPRVQPPNGGSDGDPFLRDAGIPVVELGFSGPFGAYHSRYDTLRYATLFSDPGFALHRTVAQVYGLLTLRIADADVVPYSFSGYVDGLRAAFAGQTDQAPRAGVSAGDADAKRALDRLAAAARRVNSSIANATMSGDDAERARAAARELDSLVYGPSGGAAGAMPRVERAAGNLESALAGRSTADRAAIPCSAERKPCISRVARAPRTDLQGTK